MHAPSSSLSCHATRRQARGRLPASCSACCGATVAPPGVAVGAGAGNALQRGLRWMLARVGLLQAAKALEDNRAASVAALLCFAAALISSLAAGGAPSLLPRTSVSPHVATHDMLWADEQNDAWCAQTHSCCSRRCSGESAQPQPRRCMCWRAFRRRWRYA